MPKSSGVNQGPLMLGIDTPIVPFVAAADALLSVTSTAMKTATAIPIPITTKLRALMVILLLGHFCVGYDPYESLSWVARLSNAPLIPFAIHWAAATPITRSFKKQQIASEHRIINHRRRLHKVK